jgi:hypothetical protein
LGISADTFGAGKIDNMNGFKTTFGFDVFHDLFVRASILIFLQDAFYY